MVGHKRYFVRFEYGFKKELRLIQLTVTKQERITRTEEYEEAKIPVNTLKLLMLTNYSIIVS